MSKRGSIKHVMCWRYILRTRPAQRAEWALRAAQAELAELQAQWAKRRCERDTLLAAWAEQNKRTDLADLVALDARLGELDELEELAKRQTRLAERKARLAERKARLAERQVKRAWRAEQDELQRANNVKPPIECRDLGLRAMWFVSKLPHAWTCLGFFLPPHSKKLLGYDLDEHTSDFYAALADAGSRGQQNWLSVCYTVAAFAKVLDRTRIALQNRLLDEVNWTVGKLPRK